MNRKPISMETHKTAEKLLELYHQRLAGTPELMTTVMKSTGIGRETIRDFKLGYCDGSAKKLIPAEGIIRDELIRKKILRKNGEEHFNGYMTVGIRNGAGVLAEIAGLKVLDAGYRVKRAELVKERGFLNIQAFLQYKTIYLTYNLLEFFQRYTTGRRDLVPILSRKLSEGQKRIFTDEGILEARCLFSPKDRYLKADLKSIGIPVYAVKSLDDEKKTLVKFKEDKTDISGKPAGAGATGAGATGAGATGAGIIRAGMPQPEALGSWKETAEGYEYEAGGRLYRLSGVEGRTKKAVVKFSIDGRSGEEYFDVVDFYVASQRQRMAKELTRQFGIDTEVASRDLNRITSYLEASQEKRLSKPVEKPLTEEEKAEGMAFLKDPKLLERIREDMSELGYIGERINKIIAYLVATSRKMESPLAAIIISRSAAGKSKLIESVERMMPEEDVVSMSTATDQAFFYMTDGMLKHKLVTIAEQAGKATADYPIRELLSKKSLSKAVPVRDGEGNTRTVFVKVEGPISYLETTTNIDVHPENASRCFMLYVDETQKQTERVHELQREKHEREGYANARDVAAVIRRHRALQKLLQPVKVFIPFAKSIRFPSNRLRTRRDQEKFLNLIEVIAFLFQYQREQIPLEEGNGEVRLSVDATLEDYRRAYELVKDGVLQTTLEEMPKGSRDLLNLIRKMTQADPSGIFTRREVMEFTSWGFTQVRDHIKNLLDLEYISLIKGQKAGTKHVYRLILTNDQSPLYIKNMLTPEELREEIGKTRKKASGT